MEHVEPYRTLRPGGYPPPHERIKSSGAALSAPLNTPQAARFLGISPRELHNTLKRYQNVSGIVERHGRKTLFYQENISLIRRLRRSDAEAAQRGRQTNSQVDRVAADFDRVVADLQQMRGRTNSV